MTPEQQEAILGLARQSVASAIAAQGTPPFWTDDEVLCERRGAFVTLRTHDRLRGCLGRFTSDLPLWETVREMAASAATRDPRFVHDRLRPEELGDCHIEISVLSPLRRTDNPLDLELGTHGIYIKKGTATGCFLPQVAIETGWSKQEFLDSCCSHKAHLAPGAWKDPDTEVYLFTAEVIQEEG